MSTSLNVQSKITSMKAYELKTGSFTLNVEHESGCVTFFFDTKQELADFRRHVIDAVYLLISRDAQPRSAA